MTGLLKSQNIVGSPFYFFFSRWTDSTTLHRKNSDLVNEGFMAARHEEGKEEGYCWKESSFFFHPPVDGEKKILSSPHFHVLFSYTPCVDLTRLPSQSSASRREKKVSVYFLVCEGLSYRTMTVGVSRDTVIQEIRPGAGFKTGDFVKEKLGGLP